jgi:hypothetical protein
MIFLWQTFNFLKRGDEVGFSIYRKNYTYFFCKNLFLLKNVLHLQ